ncbi:hypothetical protein EQG49_00330 [Periweissella cryptocerci]|uniref:Uncharacterized protein n=1 Tax=Periweissella cryptocerci TaxID=2506420 RepID=A0A4P6YQX2_9LACO|nr:hypothetical protein [Periweissella cryptocerci]QBO35001.1 hypothetical protein EQG49_00330 [Periweissella cryptocerci]
MSLQTSRTPNTKGLTDIASKLFVEVMSAFNSHYKMSIWYPVRTIVSFVLAVILTLISINTFKLSTLKLQLISVSIMIFILVVLVILSLQQRHENNSKNWLEVEASFDNSIIESLKKYNLYSVDQINEIQNDLDFQLTESLAERDTYLKICWLMLGFTLVTPYTTLIQQLASNLGKNLTIPMAIMLFNAFIWASLSICGILFMFTPYINNMFLFGKRTNRLCFTSLQNIKIKLIAMDDLKNRQNSTPHPHVHTRKKRK